MHIQLKYLKNLYLQEININPNNYVKHKFQEENYLKMQFKVFYSTLLLYQLASVFS